MSEIGIGVTNPMQATLAPGGPVASISWKPRTPGESYKAEIAAYELDKLLGLNMVPVTVEKRVNGDLGAAKIWVTPTQSFEQLGGPPTPPTRHIGMWDLQIIRAKMFDSLIYNADLNLANWLVDPSWNLILIDHNRAFTPLRMMSHELTKIDIDLWEKMKALDEPTLKAVLGEWLSAIEIRAILERREMMERKINNLTEPRASQSARPPIAPTLVRASLLSRSLSKQDSADASRCETFRQNRRSRFTFTTKALFFKVGGPPSDVSRSSL